MFKFIVHGFELSPYVQAVVIAIAEKHGTATVQPIADGGVRSETHLALHPFGKIPVLEHDGVKLYETQAILRYLDRLIPDPRLTPVDIRQAARMDQVMNIVDQYVMMDVNRTIGFQRIIAPLFMGLESDEAVIAEAMPQARNVFRVLTELLGNQEYFGCDSISLADIMLFPHLNLLSATPEWTELTLGADRLTQWMARIRSRPSVPKCELPATQKQAA